MQVTVIRSLALSFMPGSSSSPNSDTFTLNYPSPRRSAPAIAQGRLAGGEVAQSRAGTERDNGFKIKS
jgi:hypothetical protein